MFFYHFISLYVYNPAFWLNVLFWVTFCWLSQGSYHSISICLWRSQHSYIYMQCWKSI